MPNRDTDVRRAVDVTETAKAATMAQTSRVPANDLVTAARFNMPAGVLSVALATAVLLHGCDSRPRGSDGLILGTVSYRERSALPLDVVVELRLEDQTSTEGAPRVLESYALATAGRQVPIPFEIRYPARLVDPERDYGLHVEIRAVNGKLLFVTAKPEPVFRDGPAAEFLKLVLLRATRVTDDAALPQGPWRLVAMRREDEPTQPMSPEPVYTVEFEDDGSLAGLAHCVAFTGRYKESDWRQLSISKLVAPTTRCDPPSRADEFLRSLDRINHYELRADRLVLLYGVGGELTFDRS